MLITYVILLFFLRFNRFVYILLSVRLEVTGKTFTLLLKYMIEKYAVNNKRKCFLSSQISILE